jgi:hypothetical protein
MSENAINELKARCEDGELTEDMVADTIEAIEGEIGAKCDSIAEVIASNDGEIAKYKAEIKRLNDRLLRLQDFGDYLKHGLMAYLKHQDKRRIKTDFHDFSICKNGGKTSIALDDNMDIPEQYLVLTPKPDMDAIRSALENGENLDFACFVERGEHLRIK